MIICHPLSLSRTYMYLRDKKSCFHNFAQKLLFQQIATNATYLEYRQYFAEAGSFRSMKTNSRNEIFHSISIHASTLSRHMSCLSHSVECRFLSDFDWGSSPDLPLQRSPRPPSWFLRGPTSKGRGGARRGAWRGEVWRGGGGGKGRSSSGKGPLLVVISWQSHDKFWPSHLSIIFPAFWLVEGPPMTRQSS